VTYEVFFPRPKKKYRRLRNRFGLTALEKKREHGGGG